MQIRNLFLIFAYKFITRGKTAKLTLILFLMKKFIILFLAIFAFAINFAVATNRTEPPEKAAKEAVQKFDFIADFVANVPRRTVTEPQTISSTFRAIRLNLFLWKEKFRQCKHEHLSNNQVKFRNHWRANSWDFTSDLKRKETANKTLFETPDYAWGDSKIATEK